MNKIDLIYSIRKRLFLQALDNYRTILNRDYDNQVENEYLNAIRFYQSLSDTEQKHVLFFIETIIDDTICNFLSWIDGVYLLSGQNGTVDLSIGGQKVNINGALSDIWKNLQEDGTKEDLEDFYDD
ncbi:MAG: hypothetical protein JFR39_01560 [Muribaculaceae bacterium]|nr:hypothetical protein [Muribaculaceae bacterium]